MKKCKHSDRGFLVVAIGIMFIAIYVLNCMTPLIVDDYSFQYGVDGEKISSFRDILLFEISNYKGLTGRVLVHSIAQFFLWVGKPIFNIVNSVVYVIISILIWNIISDKKSPYAYVLICIAMWLFIPVFGQTCLWLDGACNYLWGIFFVLLFGLPYAKAWRGKKYTMWFSCVMLLIGFLAGMCNENTSGGAILWALGTMVAFHVKKEKIPLWMYVGLVGCLCGYIFMIAAPGNWVRKGNVLATTIENPIIRYGAGLAYALVNYSELWILILLECLLLLWLWKEGEKEKFAESAFYFFISLAVNFVMTFAGSYPARAMTGSTIFLIIACGKGITTFYSCYEIQLKKYRKSGVALLSLYCMLLFCMAVGDIWASNIVRSDREAQAQVIVEEYAEGERNMEIPEIRPLTKYNAQYGLEDIFINENHWTNQLYAREYGLDSIKMNGNAYRTWGQVLKLILKGEYSND
jgi:hypothetical protein